MAQQSSPATPGLGILPIDSNDSERQIYAGTQAVPVRVSFISEREKKEASRTLLQVRDA